MIEPEFVPFPKIARWNREIIITEKIDGTNACIHVGERVIAGSRSRWLTPGKNDNFGFAAWVEANRDELVRLGPGTHWGEWWGRGVQRGYGLDERRFSLFNVRRWKNRNVLNPGTADSDIPMLPQWAPKCCHVVPALYEGRMSAGAIAASLAALRLDGSAAAPGFAKPEGIVIFHTASNGLYKVTLEKDDVPKSKTVDDLLKFGEQAYQDFDLANPMWDDDYGAKTQPA